MGKGIYEVVILVRGDVGDVGLGEVCGEVAERIKAGGGEIRDRGNWGIRKLAYRVDKASRAYYIYYVVECDVACLGSILELGRIDERILRVGNFRVSEEEFSVAKYKLEDSGEVA